MFNWQAAEERLRRISKKQITQFLRAAEKENVYGLGFFCDAFDGVVYLVANSEEHCLNSLCSYKERFGPTDAEVFRWHPGNWMYPGGLFPSSSPEQVEFDGAWKEIQETISQMDEEDQQAQLEEVCRKVLSSLIQDGTLSTIPSLQGVTIIGPDDPPETGLEKKNSLYGLFGSRRG